MSSRDSLWAFVKLQEKASKEFLESQARGAQDFYSRLKDETASYVEKFNYEPDEALRLKTTQLLTRCTEHITDKSLLSEIAVLKWQLENRPQTEPVRTPDPAPNDLSPSRSSRAEAGTPAGVHSPASEPPELGTPKEGFGDFLPE